MCAGGVLNKVELCASACPRRYFDPALLVQYISLNQGKYGGSIASFKAITEKKFSTWAKLKTGIKPVLTVQLIYFFYKKDGKFLLNLMS